MVAVGTIQRITKTMQMIATAKFTAAVVRAKATKPYSEKIRQLVAEVGQAAGDVSHPLINGPAEKVNRELLLVISSDRGLCGAYNANVLRKALHHIRALRTANTPFELETSGKKAVGFFKFQKTQIEQRHAFGDKPKFEDVQALAQRYIKDFTAGKYDAIRVASMRFVSNSRQVPEVMQLLPLKPPAETQDGATAGESQSAGAATAKAVKKEGEARGVYEFSPSVDELLASLLPAAVTASLFQAFNDAIVSEQILRMVAMKAATENARELGKLLKRRYNRARQTQITTELTEIVGGAAALE